MQYSIVHIIPPSHKHVYSEVGLIKAYCGLTMGVTQIGNSRWFHVVYSGNVPTCIYVSDVPEMLSNDIEFYGIRFCKKCEKHPEVGLEMLRAV